jgi:nitrogen fixation/metabolism regulation signal transduction histidine kinase
VTTDSANNRRRRISLQVKLVVVLLTIALAPLAVSALLIDQIAEVAQNFASNNTARLKPHLVNAQGAYRDLVASKKQVYRHIAMRVAGGDEQSLAELFELDEHLVEIRIYDAEQVLVAKKERDTAFDPDRYRELTVEENSVDGGRVEVVFAADKALSANYRELGQVLEESKRVERVRASLPASYRTGFLFLVGSVVLVVTFVGIVVARRTTKRIAELVEGTRQVATGDLAARVEPSGRDELAELSTAFNRMVEEIESDRQQILYLQRIGAWQDVARRLAHEIKNPLTPIQLAVQQLVSRYNGDDERFQRMLNDADEIVGEEITNLRRLVDAFSALGRLPQVDAKPLDLGTVVDDLTKDPIFVDRLEPHGPKQPVTVRGDRLLLRRVVANLVENGMQAGEIAGNIGNVAVTWRADERAGRAILTVDDEGDGIDDKQRERIFEPYVTSKETGTGLGLAISKKIALEHRGSLDLSAEPAPTGGARFVLTVPLYVDDEA